MCKANVSGTGTPTRYKTFCHVGSQNENCEWQVWTANCANVPVCCQVKYPLALPFMVLPVWYQQNTGKWYAVCWYWTHTYARMTHAYTHASTHARMHTRKWAHTCTHTHTHKNWMVGSPTLCRVIRVKSLSCSLGYLQRPVWFLYTLLSSRSARSAVDRVWADSIIHWEDLGRGTVNLLLCYRTSFSIDLCPL